MTKPNKTKGDASIDACCGGVSQGERAMAMWTTMRLLLLLPIHLWWFNVIAIAGETTPAYEFPRHGTVIELDDKTFDSGIAAFDLVLVDFYAPWCGHCKRLAPELDAAAPLLAQLDQPIMIAKINADKYRNLAAKYEIDGFPTMKLFMHGTPVDYSGPRKAELLVRFLKKFVAPDVSVLENHSAVLKFVEMAGIDFPMFIGFGLNESVILDISRKYKNKAWFSVARDFSEEMMVAYNFDKVPALVSLLPKYNEKSVFHGPFDGPSLEDFIKHNQLPLIVPIRFETLKLMNDDDRKIFLTIVEDELDENSPKLFDSLRTAATSNRDLVFGYVGVKQWEEFVDAFAITKSSKLPKFLVWDGNEEYHVVVGFDNLTDDDHGSHISHFLEGYREGRTMTKKLASPSVFDYISSFIGIRTAYLIVILVAIVVAFIILSIRYADSPQVRQEEAEDTGASHTKSGEDYQPGDKED